MTNQIIYCEKSCGKEFTLPPHQAYPITDGIEKNCFFCPYCGHEYVAYYTDAEIRELQEQIRKIDRQSVKAQKQLSKTMFNQLTWRHTKLRKEIADKMSALRERVEADVLLQ